jgi:hypothetical protein
MLQRMKVLLKSVAGFGIIAFSFYWFAWPYFLFQEPKAAYFVEDYASEIAKISGQAICDVEQTQQRLFALVRLKSPDMQTYFRNSVRISDGLMFEGCTIHIPSGFDASIYKINDACWLTDMRFNLMFTDCKNQKKCEVERALDFSFSTNRLFRRGRDPGYPPSRAGTDPDLWARNRETA